MSSAESTPPRNAALIDFNRETTPLTGQTQAQIVLSSMRAASSGDISTLQYVKALAPQIPLHFKYALMAASARKIHSQARYDYQIQPHLADLYSGYDELTIETTGQRRMGDSFVVEGASDEDNLARARDFISNLPGFRAMRIPDLAAAIANGELNSVYNLLSTDAYLNTLPDAAKALLVAGALEGVLKLYEEKLDEKAKINLEKRRDILLVLGTS